MVGGSREENPPIALGDALEQRSMKAGQFVLTAVALAAGCLWAGQAAALGLGRLTVQSALGETLKAEIDVTSLTSDEAGSLALRIASPDAYRAAGVEFNAALSGAQVSLQRRSDGRPFLRVQSDRPLNEPFVDVMPAGSTPETRSVRASNIARIAIHRPPGSDLLMVLVVEDNLVKGASGQGVQVMNLMFGLPEGSGLDQVPVLP